MKISPHSNSLPAHIHFKSMRLEVDPAGAPQNRLVWRRSRKKFGKEEGGSGGENRLRVTFIMCSSINFFSFVLAGLRNTSTRGGWAGSERLLFLLLLLLSLSSLLLSLSLLSSSLSLSLRNTSTGGGGAGSERLLFFLPNPGLVPPEKKTNLLWIADFPPVIL